MENLDIPLSHRQMKINVDGKIATAKFHFYDDTEHITFDIDSEEELTDMEMERVKCTVEKTLLDYFFKKEHEMEGDE